MISKPKIIEKLKTINDPELNLDIWTLGLIYEINIENSDVYIRMTFTFPGCPYGPWLLDTVKTELSSIKNIGQVKIDLTFDPPWKPSEELKEILGV